MKAVAGLILLTCLLRSSSGAYALEEAGPLQEDYAIFAPQLLNTLYFDHVEGRGLGYDRGYSSVGLFAMQSGFLPENFFPFLDLREHIFNDGRQAFNLGGGIRYRSNFLSGALGVNVYEDYLRNGHQSLNQVGVGGEYLNDYCDVRLNGYFPVGRRQNFIGNTFYAFPGGYTVLCMETKQLLTGVDGEIGIPIFRQNPNRFFSLYAAAGLYYYQSDNENITGFKARVSLDLTNFLSLEVRATTDRVFHERVQGVVRMNFPLSAGRGIDLDALFIRFKDLISQPVQRNEIIVLDESDCHWITNY